jgi:hypothetical protein
MILLPMRPAPLSNALSHVAFKSIRVRHQSRERQRPMRVRSCMEDRSLIERLARHLAAAQPEQWSARVEDAASILALIKEPDSAMRASGDAETWSLMIDAALRERWSLPRSDTQEDEPGGSDEEGEIRLTPDTISHDRADWVHLHHGQEQKA